MFFQNSSFNQKISAEIVASFFMVMLANEIIIKLTPLRCPG